MLHDACKRFQQHSWCICLQKGHLNHKNILPLIHKGSLLEQLVEEDWDLTIVKVDITVVLHCVSKKNDNDVPRYNFNASTDFDNFWQRYYVFSNMAANNNMQFVLLSESL